MSNSRPLMNLLRYVLIATPICVLIFLAISGFFSSWNGHAVSVRPTQSENPASYTVLIVDYSGDHSEVSWPAGIVESLNLPFNPTGIPPTTIDEAAPKTRKLGYTLSFTVQKVETSETETEGAEGETESEAAQVTQTGAMTSPQTLAVALLIWLLGLGVHNMMLSGSPFDLTRRPKKLAQLAPAGQVAPTKRRGRKGPPPQRRRKRGR